MRGYHSDMLNVSDHEDLIQLVIDPPCFNQQLEPTIKIQTSIQMALTLECIWNNRNQVVHQAKQVNQHSILAIKELESRIVEQSQALESEEKDTNYKIMNWTTPSIGLIKLNLDVAMFNNSAT